MKCYMLGTLGTMLFRTFFMGQEDVWIDVSTVSRKDIVSCQLH